MQSMLEAVTPKLTGGKKMLSRTVPLNLGEGDVAAPLKAIQAAHDGVMIGSYPFEGQDGISAPTSWCAHATKRR
jgi:molybdopterin-biosynthesis enzyme MoeA-like protein